MDHSLQYILLHSLDYIGHLLTVGTLLHIIIGFPHWKCTVNLSYQIVMLISVVNVKNLCSEISEFFGMRIPGHPDKVVV